MGTHPRPMFFFFLAHNHVFFVGVLLWLVNPNTTTQVFCFPRLFDPAAR